MRCISINCKSGNCPWRKNKIYLEYATFTELKMFLVMASKSNWNLQIISVIDCLKGALRSHKVPIGR